MASSHASSAHAPAPHAALAPHPAIPGAYGELEHKRQYVNSIFNDTAQDYDRVERWLSLGTGRWYRRQALGRAGLRQGMRVVDVAVGTGLVAGEALSILGATGELVGVDPSEQMMRHAAQRLGIRTVAGRADAIPFPDGSFDFLSMGYALRHVDDLHAAFREFRRVLKPGAGPQAGKLCILEIIRPRTRVGRAFLHGYLTVLSRAIGVFFRLAPRTPELWSYYWETIDQCLRPEEIVAALREAGFSDVRRHVVGGIFCEYTATHETSTHTLENAGFPDQSPESRARDEV